MDLSKYNTKDRAQTAAVRTRLTKNQGLMPPLIVGHNNWYNSTTKNLTLNRAHRDTARHHVCKGRLEGHLPVTKDMIITETNKMIHGYNRDVNRVVYEMDLIYDGLNPIVLKRMQGKLELALANLRKEIKINSDSLRVRTGRPVRESKHQGDCDRVLVEEAKSLREIKKCLDHAHTRLIDLVRRVNVCRRDGARVVKERKSAIGLSPQAVPREFRIMRSKTSISGSREQQNPLLFITTDFIDKSTVGPTNPVTPAVNHFVTHARVLIKESIRHAAQLDDLISEQVVLAQTIHMKVNATITRRLAETENLVNKIELANAHQKQTIRTTDRYRDHVMKSKTITLGAECTTDMLSCENLDRPLVRNYKNHYGNRTNEIHLLVNAGKGLDLQRSLAEEQLFKLTRGRSMLVGDLGDKKRASSIDATILRLRKREATLV